MKRTSLLELLLLTTTTTILVGCGAPPPTGGGDGPTGHPSGAVSDEARVQTLDRAAQLLSDLSGQDLDASLDSIRNDLAGREDVISIGVYDNSVWVQFADGQVLVVLGNRDQLDPNYSEKGILPDSNARIIVPVPKRVRLLNALGTVFHPAVNRIKPWFDAASYATALGDSSVEGLKNVSGDGVFYFDTHGAPLPAGLLPTLLDDGSVPGPPPSGFIPQPTGDTSLDHFVLWTSTEVTASTLLIYQDALRYGELVSIVATHDLDANGRPTVARHFGITERFIHNYGWSFGDGSVVFINACSSNNQILRNACFAAGAHIYAGWTLPVADGDSLIAALYFFDRSLGANSVLAVAPPQRPFMTMDVYARMQEITKSWNHFSIAESPTRGIRISAQVSKLVFSPESPESAVLRPAIRFMTVDEAKEQLTIYGSFGEDGGSVTMNGTPLQVVSWSTWRLICSIPRSAAGDCIVTVGGHNSNARRLTAWNGHMRFTRHYMGTQYWQSDWYVRFRADVGKMRGDLDSAPTGTYVNTHATKDAQLTYDAGGTWHNDDPNYPYEEKWEVNSGITVPYQIPANSLGTDFDFSANFDGVLNTVSIGGRAYIHDGYDDVIIPDDANNPPPPRNPHPIMSYVGSGLRPFPNGSSYDIPGGSVTEPVPGLGDKVSEWETMTAQFPPDPDAEL